MMYAFFVVGPESSGTRFVTELFIKAGCFGDGGHMQRLDDFDAVVLHDQPIVWRRSVPHGFRPNEQWTDIRACLLHLERLAFQPVMVVVHRDWYSTACSQVRLGLLPDMDSAYHQIQHAYSMIAGAAHDEWAYRFRPVESLTYESLVHQGVEPFNKLAVRYGLQTVSEVQITDGNAPYYEG